jgi:uncharacterized protein
MARKMRPIVIVRIVVVALILLSLIFMGVFAKFYTDFLWFKELHMTGVFLTTLFTKIGLGVCVGLIALAVIYGNMLTAYRIAPRNTQLSTLTNFLLEKLVRKIPFVGLLCFIAALIVSFLIGSWASTYWEIYQRFVNAAPFGSFDPLFGKDIGFYIFHLPYFRFAFECGLLIVVLSFVGSLLIYLLYQNCVFDGKRLYLAAKARTHLLVLVGLMIGSLFFFFQFQLYQMVTAGGALVNGAGYASIKIGIPVLHLLQYGSLIVAVLVWMTIFRDSLKLLGAAVLGLVGVGILGFGIKVGVQKFVVAPDELGKETPYIRWSIANTRTAYGLDKVESRGFVPAGDLAEADLKKNAATINNIRLWDQVPLMTTYSQLQEIRTYYEFLDVDNDRYMINGQYRQVMLSPRELVPAALPSRIWINEHLTYTHGYGLCMGPVTSVTAEGLPDFYLKNIPPSSTVPLTVAKPQIYYGEAEAGYAIVKTGALEFDYPSGSENAYTVYDGKGGIPLGGSFRKALFAIRFEELKIVLRNDIGPESRVLFNRQIIPRISTALPFLSYESDPYLVITKEGRLVWIVDGYTTTEDYPYSAQTGSGNYIRNSVKALIDAYDGTIECYIADPNDPIIATYAKIFKGVFKPLSDMPEDLRAHLRYPQQLFTLQAGVYSLYHMNDPQVFYNKEDVWRFPNSYSEGQEGPMRPYYTIMKLAEVGLKEEFILMVPFSPSKKENMIAWLAARCDEPDYGKLLVFEFPKQKLVYGPSQIEARINQDPEISKQLTLWNQGGSRVIRGSLLVIPVEQSLLYVQPLYLTSQTGTQNGGVPELKRVIVAYENSIAMEETLSKSLAKIFGGEPPAPEVAEQRQPVSAASNASCATVKTLLDEIDRKFGAGQEAMKRGDWAEYGTAMKEVQRLLGEVKKQSNR